METGIIFGNKIIDVVFISMAIAQIYKVIASLFARRFDISRLWKTGGMPSSHASSVTALATAVAITDGLNSTAFAISVVFAIVIMYDASGIRKAAGEHATALNKINELFNEKFKLNFNQKHLQELLGHSGLEVLVGALLGIGVALLMRGYLLG